MPRYAHPAPSKRHGVTYTPSALARFLADRLVERCATWPRARTVRILDPAVGEGALIDALLGALREAGFERLDLTAVDTDPEALAQAHAVARAHGASWTGHADDATALALDTNFDLVIANPPYVRTQTLPAPLRAKLAARFKLQGRWDLSHAVTLAAINALRPGGHVGLILSNRVLTTRGARALRLRLREHLHLHTVWDLGDTRLFDAAVLPALLVGQRCDDTPNPTPPRFVSVYTDPALPANTQAPRVASPLDALTLDAAPASPLTTVRVDDALLRVERGDLEQASAQHDHLWRLTTPTRRAWLGDVARATWKTLSDLGPVRVGIKTTADRVFLRDDWDALPQASRPEPALLHPVFTHRVAHAFRAQAPAHRMLYPYARTPKAPSAAKRAPLPLDAWPGMAAWLTQHRARLEGRAYVLRAGRAWYEPWVPQNPAGWDAPKLVWRDIAAHPTAWLDTSSALVNGDCYWLAFDPTLPPSVPWLALAVFNSTLAARFYDLHAHNRLYGQRRRFLAQYVAHFPLPDPQHPSAQRASKLAQALHHAPPSQRDDPRWLALNDAVAAAFELPDAPSAATPVGEPHRDLT